jgi:hypothetical protein
MVDDENGLPCKGIKERIHSLNTYDLSIKSYMYSTEQCNINEKVTDIKIGTRSLEMMDIIENKYKNLKNANINVS